MEGLAEPRSFNVASDPGEHPRSPYEPGQQQSKARTACPCFRRRATSQSQSAAMAPLASPLGEPPQEQSFCCHRRPKRSRPKPEAPNPLEPRPPIETLRRLRDDWGCESNVTEMRDVWDYPGVGGKARFKCGGHFVTGPPEVDRKFATCAWTSILMPATFFFVVCGPDLYAEYAWLPSGGAVALVFTVTLMLVTTFTDPGIIPRPALQLLVPGLQEEVAQAIGLNNKPGGRREDVLSCVANPYIMTEIEHLGYWWCRWCHMIQPPRAKHCRDCDCCVLREDHHCPFLNNCIGKRNYAYFYGFVTFLIVTGAFVVVGTIVWMATIFNWGYLREDEPQSVLHLATWFLAWFVIIVPGLLLVAISVFAIFHLHLVIRGRTTREVLTGRLMVDATSTLFARRGPSLLKVRQRIQFPPEVDMS